LNPERERPLQDGAYLFSRETRRSLAAPKSNAITLLPAPRILDKASHFQYLIYDFRFPAFIAAANVVIDSNSSDHLKILHIRISKQGFHSHV